MSSTPEMDRRPPSEYPCPVCHRPSSRQNSTGVKNKFFPLCSERCKLIDLGAWLDAEYRIVAEEKKISRFQICEAGGSFFCGVRAEARGILVKGETVCR